MSKKHDDTLNSFGSFDNGKDRRRRKLKRDLQKKHAKRETGKRKRWK